MSVPNYNRSAVALKQSSLEQDVLTFLIRYSIDSESHSTFELTGHIVWFQQKSLTLLFFQKGNRS